MLDIRAIRQQPDEFKRKLGRKKVDPAVIDELLAADEAWRANLTETERLKNLRNTTSEAIARKKKNGEDATDDIAQMKEVGNRIKELDDIIRQQDERIREILLSLPNVPHDSVPEGRPRTTTPSSAHGANCRSSILSQSRTGKSPKTSASSISSGR